MAGYGSTMITLLASILLTATLAQDTPAADVRIAPQTEFQTPEVRLAEQLAHLPTHHPRARVKRRP